MILTILVSGCSLWSDPDPVEVTTTPVEKPELELPSADTLRMRDIEWHLVTPDNADKVFADARQSGRPVVFFALTDKGYERLSLNISDIRAYIQQQKTIISAYERYYKKSQKALDGAVKTENSE